MTSVLGSILILIEVVYFWVWIHIRLDPNRNLQNQGRAFCPVMNRAWWWLHLSFIVMALLGDLLLILEGRTELAGILHSVGGMAIFLIYLKHQWAPLPNGQLRPLFPRPLRQQSFVILALTIGQILWGGGLHMVHLIFT